MYQEDGCNASKQVCDALDRLLTTLPTSEQAQYDYRAELQRLVAALDRLVETDPFDVARSQRQFQEALQRARAIAF